MLIQLIWIKLLYMKTLSQEKKSKLFRIFQITYTGITPGIRL